MLRLKEKADPTKLVLPLHIGIGQIACGVDDPENITIVPIATVYGKRQKNLVMPTSFVGKPFRPPETPEEVREITTVNLQAALNKAAELAGLKVADV